jgi:glycosyltransferase involved in cell wall biosynthesis
MKRPTITLAMICKNEINNFPKLLQSVEGCFDEIHVTDTGSTDGTLEFLQELEKKGEVAGAKFKLKQFEWCDDFAAARNHSYSDITTDYAMWMDLDDTLSNKEAFKQWRDTAMALNNYWFCTYNYAYEGTKPIIAFLRERVINMSLKPQWRFFIHEGILPPEGSSMYNVFSWTINHGRTVADVEKDRGRNLGIFERNIKKGVKLCPRLKFYYGKELFEIGNHLEAWRVLKDVVTDPGLEVGDRVLTLQYLSSASLILQQPQTVAECIAYTHQGLQIDPTRAEYWCLLGDAYFSQGRPREAYAFYNTSRTIPNRVPASGKVHDFITHFDDYHNIYPMKQIAKCLFNMGEFLKCQQELLAAKKHHQDPELDTMLADVEKVLVKVDRDPVKMVKTSDIVITCYQTPYEWDDKVYKSKGIGGSETAAVELAHNLRKLTGRRVIVFNMRESDYTAHDGVEYRRNSTLNDYFSCFEPELHIAWRHNLKVTDGPTYLWCHDLITPGCESEQNFDQILCLSGFHRNYVQSIQGIPSEKILMTRNGIDPERFKKYTHVPKNPNKIVFPSSPDRGLERAIKIVEKAREKNPDLELHVYYGWDNLTKYGLGPLKIMLEKMVNDRPWVKYHGNVQQDVLAKELCEAAVWLYPANFIESFCITAIECIAARCFPLVRDIGALPYTLSEATLKNQALVIDRDAQSEEDIEYWSLQLVNLVNNKAWEKMDMDFQRHSWESVAREWCFLFGLDIVTDDQNVRKLHKPSSGWLGNEPHQQASY